MLQALVIQQDWIFQFNDVLLYTSPIATGGYRFNNALTLVGMKVSWDVINNVYSLFQMWGIINNIKSREAPLADF